LNLFKRSLPYKVLNRFLKVTGLYERGHRSYLSPELRYTEIRLPRLPAAFDGLRILHLVDLHLDLCPALADIVRGIIAPLDYDLCLVTGDFRDSLIGPGLKGVELSAELLREIQRPVFGSLGNHDLASDVPLLEASGMRLLINEHTWLERDGQRLYIAGIDDSAYMGAYDVDAALGGIPDGACIVRSPTLPMPTSKPPRGTWISCSRATPTGGRSACPTAARC
jgi:predicted MPP superfamily phosphohydrolase